MTMLQDIVLTNGKKVAEAEQASRRKVESIYRDSWEKGISVPFFDGQGNIYLANPDGSEDKVKLDVTTRNYEVIERIKEPRSLNICTTLGLEAE